MVAAREPPARGLELSEIPVGGRSRATAAPPGPITSARAGIARQVVLVVVVRIRGNATRPRVGDLQQLPILPVRTEIPGTEPGVVLTDSPRAPTKCRAGRVVRVELRRCPVVSRRDDRAAGTRGVVACTEAALDGRQVRVEANRRVVGVVRAPRQRACEDERRRAGRCAVRPVGEVWRAVIADVGTLAGADLDELIPDAEPGQQPTSS